MKIQRSAGVNGKKSCMSIKGINKGGTAETSVPWNQKLTSRDRGFLCVCLEKYRLLQ